MIKLPLSVYQTSVAKGHFIEEERKIASDMNFKGHENYYSAKISYEVNTQNHTGLFLHLMLSPSIKTHNIYKIVSIVHSFWVSAPTDSTGNKHSRFTFTAPENKMQELLH